ncbi:hypothetical protein IscW_ISCW006072 [Ixodes scapularis]|uniref:Uncharacterized protein n=1 Tax=Ixodes scapularis TaxID=6945 RepID=B7PR59_IXOSC|nr:hypothetical protein IscW_ISCW006072 [Ixodes scapularis]|eukprot:XP_002436251.1 hypothetical protein IscW_ISCW006072 [Ixodes scapularis]
MPPSVYFRGKIPASYMQKRTRARAIVRYISYFRRPTPTRLCCGRYENTVPQ